MYFLEFTLILKCEGQYDEWKYLTRIRIEKCVKLLFEEHIKYVEWSTLLFLRKQFLVSDAISFDFLSSSSDDGSGGLRNIGEC